MKFPLAAALIAVVLVIVGLTAWWMMAPEVVAPPELTEPGTVAVADRGGEDDIAHRDLMAKQALELNCLVCHEMRMITGLRLTPAQWKAEVDKMVTWGAVVSDGDRGLIADYLARTYPADASRPAPEFIALASVESPELPDADEEPIEGDADAGGRLYMTNCSACHGPAGMGGELGPSLANRAIIGHAAAYDAIVQKGLRRMPPFEQVLTPQQQRNILVWLRGVPRDAVARAL